MRTFHAGLEPLVAAVGAWDHVSLGPRKKIDHKSDKPEEKDEKHPQDGAIHAARFGVSRHPNQKRNAEDDPGDPEKDDAAAATRAGHATGSAACVIILCPNCL